MKLGHCLLLKLMLALTNPKDPKNCPLHNMVEADVLTHVRAGPQALPGPRIPIHGMELVLQNGKPGITQRSCSKKCTAIVTI